MLKFLLLDIQTHVLIPACFRIASPTSWRLTRFHILACFENNFIDRKKFDRSTLDRSKFVDRSNICDRSYWSIKNSNLTSKVRFLDHVIPHHSEEVLQVFHNLFVFFWLIILYFICFIIIIFFLTTLTTYSAGVRPNGAFSFSAMTFFFYECKLNRMLKLESKIFQIQSKSKINNIRSLKNYDFPKPK